MPVTFTSNYVLNFHFSSLFSPLTFSPSSLPFSLLSSLIWSLDASNIQYVSIVSSVPSQIWEWSVFPAVQPPCVSSTAPSGHPVCLRPWQLLIRSQRTFCRQTRSSPGLHHGLGYQVWPHWSGHASLIRTPHWSGHTSLIRIPHWSGHLTD